MGYDNEFDNKINKLTDFISESNSIVFFGGAGVSTESGIPDFRSKDGLYNQHDVEFDMSQNICSVKSAFIISLRYFLNFTDRKWMQEM